MPKVTVLMPVYNSESYLRESIDSILSQSFSDFEFLIIDDGSTDSSKQIIDSYDDSRIRRESNAVNEGIVATLNKGLDLARGEYVAIMHADDVSLSQRLQAQSDFLDAHPDVSIVAVKAAFVNATAQNIENWQQDQSTTFYEQILHLLPKTNCIVHPAVMIRCSVVRAYRYNKNQRGTEDYDLWLRLAADNHKIEKIDANLLRYRVHTESITCKTDAEVGEYKEIIARYKFLVTALAGAERITIFHLRVLKHLVGDFCRISVNYAKVLFLSIAREIFIFFGKPLGIIYQKLSPLRHEVILFVSFSPNQIGGAERVHTDIVDCNMQKSPWVVLANECNFDTIRPDSDVKYRFSNISTLLRNPFTKNLALGFFAGYINTSQSVAFGGNTEFFYWLVPYLSPDIRCVDFVHGFGCQIEYISLPHVSRINRRIIIANELRNDLALLYRNHGISDRFLERVCMVKYGIDVPRPFMKDNKSKNRVDILYVGRGTSEKRVHLVGRIARHLAEKKLPVTVTLVGDVCAAVEAENRGACTFCGPVYDRNALEDIYKKADILVITSSTEGLSLVRMEAMAHGVVPVAVAVGPIPGHIKHGLTGFLVAPDQSEIEIVQEFCVIIEELINNRQLLHQVASRTYDFACCNFDRADTLHKFSKLFDFEVNN